MSAVRLYVIYDHPADFPDSFVVRRWDIGAGTITPGPAQTAPTLEAARGLVRGLVPEGICFTRAPDDDPTIVETWL